MDIPIADTNVVKNETLENNVIDTDKMVSIDDITKDHIACYQIQVDVDGKCTPVFLGMYEEIPLPVIKVIKYKKYMCHLVAYVLDKDEVDNKLYKIVGVHIVRKNRSISLYSLDFIYNVDTSQFEIVLCNNKENSYEVVEKFDKFPGKENVIELVLNKLFTNPVNKILLK